MALLRTMFFMQIEFSNAVININEPTALCSKLNTSRASESSWYFIPPSKIIFKILHFLTGCFMAIRNRSVFTRNRESSRAECLMWWIVLGAKRKVRCVSTLIKAVLLLRMTVRDTCFMINFLRTWCYWKKNDPLWEIRRWHSWVSSLQQWHRLTFVKIPTELLSSACVYNVAFKSVATEVSRFLCSLGACLK